MRFNGLELTEIAMQQTRQWFADNALAAAEDARAGRTRVNDLEGYLRDSERRAAYFLAGEGDSSVAFLQRAYYVQTGESVALLP
jgi:hypothetical protein